MSGKAFGWARDLRGLSGGGTAKAVLLLMADYADGAASLFPSVATLAEELQFTERTVQRAINSLLTDGLIEREFRTTQRGKTTSSRYVLMLGRSMAIDAGRGDTQSPLGVSESHPTGDAQSPSPPSESHHHTNLYSEPLSADALSERACADEDQGDQRAGEPEPDPVDLGEAEFEAVFAAWAAADPDRAARPTAWAAWTVAVEGGALPVDLQAAAGRYLASSGEVKRGYVRHLDRWLKDRRFEAWLIAPEAAAAKAEASAKRGPWAPLPEVLRAAFADEFGPAKAQSYGPIGWIEERRAVVAATGTAASWLNGLGRHWLKANNLTVISAAEASALASAA